MQRKEKYGFGRSEMIATRSVNCWTLIANWAKTASWNWKFKRDILRPEHPWP